MRSSLEEAVVARSYEIFLVNFLKQGWLWEFPGGPMVSGWDLVLSLLWLQGSHGIAP